MANEAVYLVITRRRCCASPPPSACATKAVTGKVERVLRRSFSEGLCPDAADGVVGPSWRPVRFPARFPERARPAAPPALRQAGVAEACALRTCCARRSAPVGVDDRPLEQIQSGYGEQNEQRQRQRAHRRGREPRAPPACCGRHRRNGGRARNDQRRADLMRRHAARPSCLSKRRFATLAATAMSRLIAAYSSTTSDIASSAWLVWLATVPPTICMMSG